MQQHCGTLVKYRDYPLLLFAVSPVPGVKYRLFLVARRMLIIFGGLQFCSTYATASQGDAQMTETNAARVPLIGEVAPPFTAQTTQADQIPR
jgi:hypothetical protein